MTSTQRAALYNQLNDFISDQCETGQRGAMPFSVFVRCFHGWSGRCGLPIPTGRAITESLADAGLTLTEGRYGDDMVPGLRMKPRGGAR
ncbi:hypothetical protein ACIQZN_15570 [Streptomyces sp. NPDC097595]|uniref:hypothetical protein n=1 Tax=Streptomyces sp. NPDC097595 TaxID=3366090 RepID=UPI00381EDFED